MTYFPWSDKYSIGVRLIDNDHRDFVNLVNTLHDAILRGEPRSRISRVIASLTKYVGEHFQREEALMEKYDYPGLARHKAIHRRLSRTVFAIRRVFALHPERIDPNKLLTFLRNWLVQHICEEDKAYAPYLRGESNSKVPVWVDPPHDAEKDPEEKITLHVPASKAALLRRCARIIADGGLEAVAIEDLVMPPQAMTQQQAIHFARFVLR